jgi:Fur family ferric uptake transcriptional regulator
MKKTRSKSDTRRIEGTPMAPTIPEEEIRSAEHVFREYLRDRGLKYTRERKTVLREVLANEQHFEAEQLLISLRQAGERVAKATIYRTLPLLVNCGIIRRVQFGDNLSRYEHALGHDPHDHMVCRQCGRVIEFECSDVLRLRAVLAARHRFHAITHRFQITGLCWECVQARPARERPFVPSGEPASTEPHTSGSSE